MQAHPILSTKALIAREAERELISTTALARKKAERKAVVELLRPERKRKVLSFWNDVNVYTQMLQTALGPSRDFRPQTPPEDSVRPFHMKACTVASG